MGYKSDTKENIGIGSARNVLITSLTLSNFLADLIFPNLVTRRIDRAISAKKALSLKSEIT